MHVIALANEADPELGLVGEHLESLGSTVRLHLREDDAAVPADAACDLVVSLGSDWSVTDQRHSAAIERETAFLRRCVDRDVPVLGICFGGQLLAHALGGRVVRAETPEIGWYAIAPRDVRGHARLPSGPYLQWHRDRFDPPPDAVVLADSPAGCQAFRLGSALALQFHPEAVPAMIERWVDGDRELLERDGVDGAQILAETSARQAEAAVRAAWLTDAALRTRRLDEPADEGRPVAP